MRGNIVGEHSAASYFDECNSSGKTDKKYQGRHNAFPVVSQVDPRHLAHHAPLQSLLVGATEVDDSDHEGGCRTVLFVEEVLRARLQ